MYLRDKKQTAMVVVLGAAKLGTALHPVCHYSLHVQEWVVRSYLKALGELLSVKEYLLITEAAERHQLCSVSTAFVHPPDGSVPLND